MTLTNKLDFELVGHGAHGVIGLHGWFGPENSWSGVPDVVDRERNTFAFFPFRGYGTRIAEAGPRTIDGAARDAIELADELGWNRFSLLGHSMGGKVAQRLLTICPERIRGVVAISPVPATGVPFDPETAEFFRSARGSQAVRRAIIDRSTGGTLGAERLDQMVARSMDSSAADTFSDYFESWAFDDFSSSMTDLRHPLLVITGDLDPDITSELMSVTLAGWFRNLTLTQMHDCGHYSQLEQPRRTMEEVQSFLETIK